MVVNNLRLAVRHLYRQKGNTALHLAGLTLGMSVCLLIALFLRHELSYDNYHSKADRIYRVSQFWTDKGNKDYHFSTPFPLADALRADIPELEQVAKILPDYDAVVEINPQKRFEIKNVLMVEPAFLNIFDVEVLRGNVYEALRNPNQAILTEKTAEQFFGKEDPIGKTFKYQNKYTMTVAGLIRNLPENTHLPADMLISFLPQEDQDQWGMVSGGSTFIVLPEKMDPHSLDARLKAIYDKNLNSNPDLPPGSRCDLVLQPLNSIHLEPQFAGGGATVQAVNPKWLWFFGSVGLAVLLLACINFINLSTAQALNRAKEVGVRKSVGAGISQLIGQFMGEAWLLSAFSGLLALIIAGLSLPALNELMDQKIAFDLFQSPPLMGGLLAGIGLTGLLAGLYPAWVIARFRPSAALKTGATAGDRRSAGLRKGLVVVQFTISVTLLVALIIISRQMSFLRSKDLGFNKGNVLLVNIPEGADKQVFNAELAQIPQIKDVSFSTNSPSAGGHWGTVMSLQDGDDPDRKDVILVMADDHFCKMYGFALKAGRFLEAADTNAVTDKTPEGQRFPRAVVNEELVRQLGFASPEAALNQRIWIGMNGWKPEIVGVIADFNTTSLRDAIKPTLITQYPGVCHKANIKIAPGSDLPRTLAAVEGAWQKSFPSGIYEYDFLDQKIDKFYKTEERLFTLFRIFAGMAMLISCLGLWGLATFAAENRRKEIGVRKVLGASAQGIVALLSRDFLVLVALSIAIASPLAYYGMSKWLTDFAYRIDIQWWMFGMAGLASVVIAILTVGFQSVKAALANPVKSLRNE